MVHISRLCGEWIGWEAAGIPLDFITSSLLQNRYLIELFQEKTDLKVFIGVIPKEGWVPWLRWTKRDAFDTYNFIHEKWWKIWLILYIWLHSWKTDGKHGTYVKNVASISSNSSYMYMREYMYKKRHVWSIARGRAHPLFGMTLTF